MPDTKDKDEHAAAEVGDAAPAPAPKRSLKDAFLSHVWDTDTHLKSPAERRLLFKLDVAMLTCLCLGFFNKYLDQSNITNAYVSGMREELGWYGNQYTYAQSLYTAAYALMQVPSTLIVQKVRPSLWLGGCEVAWAVFTFAQAGAHNTNTMYALRFMVGVTESAFFPVGLFLLGSWYTPTELAKRTAIFHFTAPAGSAFAGYLQAAVYKTLNGTHGLGGWRWLYIICGVITLPCGLLVWALLPDYPSTGRKRWWLTEAEVELARERVARARRAQTDGNINLAVLARVAAGWHVYVLPLTYIFYGLALQDAGYFGIWLKSTKKYSIELVNILPTFTSVIGAVSILAWGFGSDYTGSRAGFTLGPLTWGLFPTGVLAFWPASLRLKQAAFLVASSPLVTAVIFSWWNEICSADPLERALVISLSNGLQYAMNAWIPLLIFKQTDAPSFRKGFPTTFAFNIVALGLLVLVFFLHRRDQARGAREEDGEDKGADAKVGADGIPVLAHDGTKSIA
ncbi:hypothetical protein Q8F55_007253 [Vanrija albida]|uniref:Major facilitator superfamily (MFS) profile domain-containing protein n=1 Tax=Vanrija albida TaxID=181172 RepID=A0ABR3PZK9_9TREE